MNEKEIEAAAEKIRRSKKYRHMDVPKETIRSLIQGELSRHNREADALRSARRKLHNITAPYLDDLDYAQWQQRLANLPSHATDAEIREIAWKIMSQHDSSRERLPYLELFYQAIRNICPNAQHILDLACGLNPFALPFMHLHTDAAYHAYDIHAPRVALINQYFQKLSRPPLAEVRDVIIHPPRRQADAAFLFKEAHRMEKRYAGASRELLTSLRCRFIFISLPNKSLDSQRDLRRRMERLAASIFEGQTIHEILFPDETIYWVARE